jgi:AraC-like DNA-binding protein
LNFCPNDLEKLGILESELLKRLKNPSSTYRQAMDIIQSLRQIQDADPVQEFCTFHKLYYKKLERLFLKYVGYTPKSYFRLLRFNRALRQIHRRKDFLTSIALDCGYYDQSHFIKDFKQFTGLSPGRFEPDQHKVSGFLVRKQPV